MSDLMEMTLWTLWEWSYGPMVSRRCPYQFDLIEPYENVPIKMIRIDEKWMNRVNRGEMSDLMEMTWNNPMGMVLWVGWECPYGSDWNEPYEKVPIKMNGIDEKWMNRGRISEIKWNEWFDGFDLEQPYEKVPMVDRRCPYQNDLNEPYENVPIKMIRFDWIEVNRTIWGDMSELKEVS